jgi:hypothetical protein
MRSLSDYTAWCRRNRFGEDLEKSCDELDREWLAFAAESARTSARWRVERDPGKLLLSVCSGEVPADELARPRWRELAQRIQSAALLGPERRALSVLVEVALRRTRVLLGEGRFGDRSYPFLAGLIALSRRKRDWLRAPEEWRPSTHNASRQFGSLVRHLVARYPVPSFLDAAWLRSDADAEHYRDWFVRAGTGMSLSDCASPLPLTKRILHHFLRAPDHYAIEQALRWGQIHALGGDARLVEAIAATRLGTSFEHEAFWSTVIRFFVQHPEYERSQVGPAIDYLQHQRFEPQPAANFDAPWAAVQPNLSMQGRSPDALLRQVERWHRELARAGHRGRGISWASSGISPLAWTTGSGETRQISRTRELLSSAALSAEGRLMRHCVATYARVCAAGGSSIWALELHSRDGIHKRQTVEVSHGVIVQTRGRFNALPTPKDLATLRVWAAQAGLRLASHVSAAT